MKKGWKIFWICIAALTGIGIVCCITAFCMGFSFYELEKNYPNGIGIFRDDDRFDEDDWESDDWDEVQDSGVGKEFSNIRNLEIKANACQIVLAKSKDDKIRVDDSNLKKDSQIKMETSDDGDILHIEIETQGIRKRQSIFAVYIPENVRFDEVTMDVGAAEVEIKDIHAAQLSIKGGAADCSVENATVEQLKAETGVGDLDFYGSVDGNIDVKCGAGDLELNLAGKEEKYNYDLRGGVGSIEIGENLEIDGLNGKRVIDNKSDYTIQVVSGAGDVEIDFH